jgi:hypothetical protein
LVIFVIFVIIFDKMPKRKGLKFNLPEIWWIKLSDWSISRAETWFGSLEIYLSHLIGSLYLSRFIQIWLEVCNSRDFPPIKSQVKYGFMRILDALNLSFQRSRFEIDQSRRPKRRRVSAGAGRRDWSVSNRERWKLRFGVSRILITPMVYLKRKVLFSGGTL